MRNQQNSVYIPWMEAREFFDHKYKKIRFVNNEQKQEKEV